MTKLRHYGEATLTIIVLLAFTWGFFWIDGQHDDIPFTTDETQQTQATSTVEFDLSGIDNRENLKKRLQIVIKETKAQQQKQEATETLQKLQKKKTSLR